MYIYRAQGPDVAAAAKVSMGRKQSVHHGKYTSANTTVFACERGCG